MRSSNNYVALSQSLPLCIHNAVKSFVELVKFIFKIPGVSEFLSRNICQDPLEKFFGCQRQMGATHSHPSLNDYQRNAQALRVVNSFCKDIVKGNCRGSKRPIDKENCDQPLPKRCKSRAKKQSQQVED